MLNELNKKLPKLKKKKTKDYTWLIAIIIFAIVFSMVLYYSLPKLQEEETFKYSITEEGITFYSNVSKPNEFLQEFKNSNKFTLVMQVGLDDKSTTFTGSAMVMMQALLTASEKNPIALIKNYENGSLSSCQTNKGSVGINEKINLQECNEMLNSKDSKFIIINDINGSLKETSVILKPEKVIINARKGSEVQTASYLLLKGMFADSDEKIKLINEYLQNASD